MQWFVLVAKIVTGSSFGELALIGNCDRAATITCVSDVYVAVLNKNDYQRVLKRGEQKQLNKKMDFFH
jgi:CRP-like cAMP-binding protein